MEDENGELARVMLRKAKAVNADEKFWRKIIWDLEKKENRDKQGGDENDRDEYNEG